MKWNQAYTYLKQSNSRVFKDDIFEKIIDAQNYYLHMRLRLITVLILVTVENAKEKRNEMINLVRHYLKIAANCNNHWLIEVA